MKKYTLLFLALIIVIFGVTGCSKYSSHYSAIAHGSSNDSDSASVFFWKFEGIEVFKMKIESGKTAKIQYSGKMESGSLTVSYDCGGTKTELFSIHSGDEVNACSEEITSGLVYIILETHEQCETGDFSFEINYD